MGKERSWSAPWPSAPQTPGELECLVGRFEAQVNPVAAGGRGRHLDVAAERGAEPVTDAEERRFLVGVQLVRAFARPGLAAGGRVRAAGALLEYPDRPAAVDGVAG